MNESCSKSFLFFVFFKLDHRDRSSLFDRINSGCACSTAPSSILSEPSALACRGVCSCLSIMRKLRQPSFFDFGPSCRHHVRVASASGAVVSGS